MRTLLVAALAILVSGCATLQKEPPVIASTKSSVEMRSMQSRIFDTNDRSTTVRIVIATLQDLGYNIDKVDAGSGTVTATKLAQLKLSASVTARGTRMAVRANAQIKLGLQSNQVDAPQFYQTLFFEPLSTAMFLKANTDDTSIIPTLPMRSAIEVPAQPPQS